MRQVKTGLAFTKENKKYDIIYGIRKRNAVGNYIDAYELEKILLTKYGMTEAEIEHAVYEMSEDEVRAKIWA